jgi:hypothetical protein
MADVIPMRGSRLSCHRFPERRTAAQMWLGCKQGSYDLNRRGCCKYYGAQKDRLLVYGDNLFFLPQRVANDLVDYREDLLSSDPS